MVETGDAPVVKQEGRAAAASVREQASFKSVEQAYSLMDEHSRQTRGSTVDCSPNAAQAASFTPRESTLKQCFPPGYEQALSPLERIRQLTHATGDQSGVRMAQQSGIRLDDAGRREVLAMGFPDTRIQGAGSNDVASIMGLIRQRAAETGSAQVSDRVTARDAALGEFKGARIIEGGVVTTDQSKWPQPAQAKAAEIPWGDFSGARVRTDGVVTTDQSRWPAATPPKKDEVAPHLSKLLAADASPEDKLNATRKLAESGVGRIVATNPDGSHTTLVPKMGEVEGRKTFSLHAIDDKGQVTTVLRGIEKPDHTLEQQRDSRGNFVSYYGKGKEALDAASRSKLVSIDMQSQILEVPGPQMGTQPRRSEPVDAGQPMRRQPDTTRRGDLGREQTPADMGPPRGGVEPRQPDQQRHREPGHRRHGRHRSDSGDGHTERAPEAGDRGSASELAHHIADVAKESLGKKMWRAAGYKDSEVGGGSLGCAASVTAVLEKSGVKGVHTAWVPTLAEQLKAAGAQRHEIKDGLKPGDVVILAPPRGSNIGHCGIIGEDGKLYNNSGREWFKQDINDQLRWRGPGSYVLRFDDGAGQQRTGSPYRPHRAEAERIEREERRTETEASDKALSNMFDRAARQSQGASLKGTTEGVFLKGMLQVDADGSPRARKIDPDGDPHTSMRYTDGSSINAEAVPYAVFPKGMAERYGLKLGDFGIVRDTTTGRMKAFVYADNGPPNKRGEASMELVDQLGYRNNPRNGGSNDRKFEYLFFPQSSGGPVPNQATLLARLDAFRKRMGLD